jgi:hypothetical protein
MENKSCIKCSEVKPLTEFHKDKSKKDGYMRYCKACRKDRDMNYYFDNREECLERHREYNQNNKHNPNLTWKKSGYNNKRKKIRSEKDPAVRLDIRIRARIKNDLNAYFSRGRDKHNVHLECTISEYVNYIKSMFVGDMTWENYGDVWHIHHIKSPLLDGGSYHYTNTEPQIIEANLRHRRGYYRKTKHRLEN